MRTFPILLGLFFNLAGFCAEITQGSLFRGDWYQLEVRHELLSKTPSWDLTSQPNPPLAAAMALQKATNFISEVKKDEGCSFYLDSLSLVQHGSFWTWQAQWSYLQDTPEYQKGFEKMRCWILMDGTLVKPMVIERPKRKAEPGGAADGSQPVRTETNRTSSAAGSGR